MAKVNKAKTREPSLAAQRSIFSTSRSCRGGVALISPDNKILVKGGSLVLIHLSDITVSLQASFASIVEGFEDGFSGSIGIAQDML